MNPGKAVKMHISKAWFCMMFLLVCLPACAGQNSSKIMVRSWVLEYPAPPAGQTKPLPAAIRLKRFGAVSGYTGKEMVYRPDSNERGAYPYNRWLLSPGDMTGDLLARDFRAENSYQAVFDQNQSGRVRFELEGGVLECLELNRAKGWQARLGVHITLLDLKHNSLPQRVLLQMDYTHTSPIAQRGAKGLAQAMSQAARAISQKVRADVYKAIAARID